MSASERIQGIDVSHFQGTVNWQEVKQAGMKFAFAKATEGQSYVDSLFTNNWTNIKAAGLLRGAYHFFDAGVDGNSQAHHFLETVQVEANDLPPVIDVEAAASATNDAASSALVGLRRNHFFPRAMIPACRAWIGSCLSQRSKSSPSVRADE